MKVRIGDVGLFFDVEGTQLAPAGAAMREKPTLLCLHGGPGLDHTGFRPAFAPLARRAQVVYLDLRGHGRSDRSDASRWSLQRWADDVRAFCAALAIERPVVLGTSFGGYVGMKYAIRHRDQPAKLILISTSARGTAHPVRQQNVLRAFERRGGAAAREAARRAFQERTADAYEDYGRLCGPLYNHTRPSTAVLERTLRNPDVLPFFERPGGEGAVFDLTPELAEIRCPTLVLGGEDDPITPPAEQQAIVDAMAPGVARLTVFPACGHGVLRDDAKGLVRAIETFLAD